MEEFLRVVAPYLSDELVAPQALLSIQTLAQALPPASLAGFECRLSSDEPRVDFQLSLPRFPVSLPEHFLIHPIWQTVQHLYQDWTDSASLLHQNVGGFILEFDLVEQSSSVLIPCVLFCLNKQTILGVQELIEIILRLLSHPVNSCLQSNLSLCIDSLPDGARIAHLGVMLSRPNAGVRIVVKGLSFQQVQPYLIQIGWVDPTDNLASLLSKLPEFVDSIMLSFDVGDIIYPKIGLECFLGKGFHDTSRWQLFLDHLVGEGLCTSSKQNALLAWPGFIQKKDCPELWPVNLTAADLFLGSKMFSVFWRRINHLKIIYQPDGSLSVKGYLAFGHCWIDINDIILEKTIIYKEIS
ncbi:hypothetical protein [Nostoc sp.]|uniref:hypothetical protein n=1 Tax=Nostoc sp. TaxID=1180 RepID=UPI002FF3F777